jgi:hypothetical protein
VTPRDFLLVAVEPALRLLPARMDSIAARAFVVAVCLQESDLRHRRQKGGGPARGYPQFEISGVAGVLTHRASADSANDLLARLDYPGAVGAVHAALEHNDVLAAAFARLLLWTIPVRLPLVVETEFGWKQYLDAWRPGKPRPDDWPANYARAWREVTA